MLKVKNDQELVSELNKIIRTIAPSVVVYKGTGNGKLNVDDITPAHPQTYDVVYWQHTGLHLKWYDQEIYQNVGLNRPVAPYKARNRK
ncbi:hypothetical protein ACVWYG_002208 [Pedobacter sp. UYEF25]